MCILVKMVLVLGSVMWILDVTVLQNKDHPFPAGSCAKAYHVQVRQTGPQRHTDLPKRQTFRLSLDFLWSSWVFPFAHSPNCYTISSSPSSWAIRGVAFTQPDPRQWPHTSEHFIPCSRQLHLVVLQLVVQLQWMIFKSSRGAGGWSVVVG